MTRRIPIFSTIVVIAAVATMIALGIWQLGRAEEKSRLIEAYQDALANPAPVAWPDPAGYEDSLFRRSSVDCETVNGINPISGKSDRGRSGWVHIAQCSLADGGSADVTIGWSIDPNAPQWDGGEVDGVITSYGEGIRLVATEPQAGLQPLAQPDPNDLPNNHMAYVGQWFFFALTALVIYGFALRSRSAASRPKRD